jgi:hypothetical protein
MTTDTLEAQTALRRWDVMNGTEKESPVELVPYSLHDDHSSSYRLIELQAKNLRLQELVAELLLRNQQLRERHLETRRVNSASYQP